MKPWECAVDHTLKIWPQYFEEVASGRKPFDVRQGNDRTYKVWDIVEFREWDPITAEYTKRVTRKIVTNVLHGGAWLPNDTWVIGLREWC